MSEITVQNNLEISSSPSIKIADTSQREKEGNFGEMLKDAIGEVNKLQQNADQAVEELATGSSKDIHNTMIALEKAEISFHLMMQIRNKIIGAYQEIMRMQV
jgi:flagellar hook-basal body complex protein FliE